ncbi:hypothetical protein FNP_1639 [Fusobacterium polymorphum ATCC 10953]|uniref:Uncharacterized protein n=1 Tax=Fusobacterium polymorphum ATCC 10953 TaxID=393480 RepID=A5TWZ0_FUSNP|nr:hypothetical protein FNP_1639 [Fusobacterium polymorphum ATCC 10953]
MLEIEDSIHKEIQYPL